jgi:hypothetical protein
VLLSGGLDSGSTLAAMLETGIPFGICTFRFGDYPSNDEISAAARHQTLCPQIPFEVIEVPRTLGQAHDIATWCIENSGSVLKTAIECMVPMRPFIDGVIARGYRTLLNGMSGGMLWGVGRQAMMQLHNVSIEHGDAAGLKHWQALKRRWLEYERTGFPPNATRVCRWYTATKGGLWYDPLAELVDLMAGATYAELNRPRAKSLAVKAFPALGETPVRAGGLQVVAGVREFMTPGRSHGSHRFRSSEAACVDPN